VADISIPDSLADDRLDGAREIALFLYGNDDPQTVKAVYHEAAKGRLPIGRRGGRFFASKRKLLQAYDELTSPQPATALGRHLDRLMQPAKATAPEPAAAPRRASAAPQRTRGRPRSRPARTTK
jgi:hypothetical protein